MTPKAARNPKLGVIFAKYAPMTPSPPLSQPLASILQINMHFVSKPLIPSQIRNLTICQDYISQDEISIGSSTPVP